VVVSATLHTGISGMKEVVIASFFNSLLALWLRQRASIIVVNGGKVGGKY